MMLNFFMQAAVIIGAITGICFAIRAVIFISIVLSPFEKLDK